MCLFYPTRLYSFKVWHVTRVYLNIWLYVVVLSLKGGCVIAHLYCLQGGQLFYSILCFRGRVSIRFDPLYAVWREGMYHSSSLLCNGVPTWIGGCVPLPCYCCVCMGSLLSFSHLPYYFVKGWMAAPLYSSILCKFTKGGAYVEGRGVSLPYYTIYNSTLCYYIVVYPTIRLKGRDA